MSELKEQQENPRKISWFKSTFFPPKEYIYEIASPNIKLEALSNPKILIIIFWIISNLIHIYIVSIPAGIERDIIHSRILYHTWADFIFGLSIEIPFLYLIVRNYRVGYALFALYAISTKILPVLELGRNPGNAMFWCFLYASVSLTGIRIISAKIKLGTAKKRKKLMIFIDILIPILVFIIFFIISLLLYIDVE